MSKVYIASPLFTAFDKLGIDMIKSELDKYNLDYYNPIDNGDINDKSKVVMSHQIFKQDTSELMNCDAIIAVIDGQDIDSGVSAEIGIAYMCDIPIYALYTDIRHQTSQLPSLEFGETPHHYINQYVVGLIKDSKYELNDGGIYSNLEDLVHDLVYDLCFRGLRGINDELTVR